MTKRPLTPKEQREWHGVAKSVKPIAPVMPALESIEIGAKTVEIVPDSQDIDYRAQLEAALKSGASTPLSPRPALKPSIPNRKNERKIRRGQAAISATFDLHGHTQVSAAAALPKFLSGQRALGARCVLVITGKGKLGEGVLRRNFLHWLETHAAKSLICGYAQAHAKHGGGGAFYVFLRRRALR